MIGRCRGDTALRRRGRALWLRFERERESLESGKQRQCRSVFKRKENKPQRCALLFIAGLIHGAALTDKMFNFMFSSGNAGTSARKDFVVPKMEICVRSLRVFSMTECFIAMILKLSASGHAGFGNLVNLRQGFRNIGTTRSRQWLKQFTFARLVT